MTSEALLNKVCFFLVVQFIKTDHREIEETWAGCVTILKESQTGVKWERCEEDKRFSALSNTCYESSWKKNMAVDTVLLWLSSSTLQFEKTDSLRLCQCFFPGSLPLEKQTSAKTNICIQRNVLSHFLIPVHLWDPVRELICWHIVLRFQVVPSF